MCATPFACMCETPSTSCGSRACAQKFRGSTRHQQIAYLHPTTTGSSIRTIQMRAKGGRFSAGQRQM
eukprot:3829967-Pleurochrysis_carterae.AAC.1